MSDAAAIPLAILALAGIAYLIWEIWTAEREGDDFP